MENTDLSAVPAEAAKIYKQYIHFCDECPKVYDFTCSGADSKRCEKEKASLIDEFFKRYDRRIICVVMNEGVYRGSLNTQLSSFDKLNFGAAIEAFYEEHERFENDEFHFVRAEEANRLIREAKT